MGKDRENVFLPGKGKPSGANKEEGTGLTNNYDPDRFELDEQMTERYAPDANSIAEDVHVLHPNRNTSKGEPSAPRNKKDNQKSISDTFQDDFSPLVPQEILGTLTRDVFVSLANYRSELCVTLLIPTHKAGMEVNEQTDKIIFKNALQELEKIYAERNIGKEQVKPFMEPAYDLLRDDDFWRDMDKGLAIFCSADFFQFARLSQEVTTIIRVGSSFHVAPLIPFLVRKEYFYLLDIAKKLPRFYRVDFLGIEHLQVEEMPGGVDDVVHFEEKEAEKLFRTGGRGGTGGANFHGIGGGKPDEKKHIAMYLEEVDKTIWQSHLHLENVPLVLSGQDFLIPIYKSVSKYTHIWPEALTGNHHQQNDAELFQEVKEFMTPFFEKNMSEAINNFNNKSATPLASNKLQEVIAGAFYGRVAQLFVRKDAGVWGTFNEADGTIKVLSETNSDAGDLIDLAVAKTIENSGEVFILDQAQLPGNGIIAAVFRY